MDSVATLMALLTFLYACVVFLSAFLLFLVQPMVAKQLLPVLGGSAAVWTTCLVFFQTALFLGYVYADFVALRLRPRAQALTHVTLLAVALATLGLHIRANQWATTWHPILTIFTLLTLIIGLPYLALSATTPLLQTWYTDSFHAGWSYRMFSLSNAGALLALLAYPTVIEPHITLKTQTWGFSTGFFIFAVLCGGIAWSVRHTLPERKERPGLESESERITPQRRVLWLLLPGCASLLLCAITNHLSQNVAAIPLLWILPLSAYLLSFIVAFHSSGAYRRWLMVRLAAFTLGVLGYLARDVHQGLPVQISVPLYCLGLFVLCLFFHGELYRLRPTSGPATGFYLHVALGAAMGGLFVGVAAPTIFRANYELAIGLVLSAISALVVMWNFGVMARIFWTAVALALAWIGVMQARAWQQDALVQLRSFYGTLRVTETHWPPLAETTRTLYHGTIQHGVQLFGNGLRMQPTSYYGPDSGVGLALRYCCEGRAKRVAVVGLGAGTIAAYGKQGDIFRFFEIDPLVERIARELFTYLRESPAHTDVVLGDARFSISREHGDPFDVIVLDAFSGDAVPVHLLTQQAVALYRKHLAPGGILAFHISSQYLDLEPVLAREAQQAEMRAVTIQSAGDENHGIFIAEWVLLTNNERFLAQPEVAHATLPSATRSNVGLWTDDYSSILPILKWPQRVH
ncbi:fused MFS/spermidine synthase [Alloacidobacterium sp.]|uniref:fused MFS/spermidine synthase n=1 Tax=Alloacidobacterium sp. TaxID=2951999 RepID=UPI002D6B68F6|nr:fused MFS/spermidine synthase [Alloacidobacterium sp.]HYK34581.1 fused MFS/spermidine synthase [Alloacidobacterium sp.]